MCETLEGEDGELMLTPTALPTPDRRSVTGVVFARRRRAVAVALADVVAFVFVIVPVPGFVDSFPFTFVFNLETPAPAPAPVTVADIIIYLTGGQPVEKKY